MEGADNDTEGVATWNASGLPISTTTSVVRNVNEIITQRLFGIDLILQIFSLSEPITPCSIVDKILNACSNLLDNETTCICFGFGSHREPIHQHFAYRLQYCQDGHLAGRKDSG